MPIASALSACVCLAIALLVFAIPTGGQSVDFRHGDLHVAPNGRFLVHSDGTPFFYLGDTAWELFHRLTLKESQEYLQNRANKDFTVIQAVVLAELNGLNTPNAEGQLPLIDNDPLRPNEAYFRHVDAVVDLARDNGLYIGMLPTWGDKVNKAWGLGPVIFTINNARAYGKYIGNRYRDRENIIWILGGDRDPHGDEAVWDQMAMGLREGDGGRHLITYHPSGQKSSSEDLDKRQWLNFNLLQSGHGRKDFANYQMIEKDYLIVPPKPTMDGEPRYENHPVNWQPEKNGWFNDYDVRQAAYWAVFAGALGHTYGCHDVWQMLAPGRVPIGFARGTWFDSLDLPGASQMQFVRRLMESRPYLSRVPDQSLIVNNSFQGADHAQATRGDGYALLYLATGKPVQVQMGTLSGATIHASWYDPRTGEAKSIGLFDNSRVMTFTPPGLPGIGNDWILVLDDIAKGFGPPGTPIRREAHAKGATATAWTQ